MHHWLPARHIVRCYICWALLIFLAGFYFFPKSKPHNTAYYVLVLLPFLLTLRRQDIRDYWQSSIFRLTTVFLGYLVLSLAWGEQTTANDWVKYAKRLIYMLGFACMVITCYNPKFTRQLGLVISGTAIVMAIVSMAIYDSSMYSGPDRLKNFGILEHEILAASTYGFAALMLCYGVKLKVRYIQWVKLIGLTILVLDMMLTQSRGPMIALISAIIVAELLAGTHRKIIYALLITALVTGLLMVNNIIDTPFFISRNGGDSYRFLIWQQIWQRVMDAPWFGLGLSANETIQLPACSCIPHPHNIFLATMLYGGVVGLLFLLTLLVHSLITAYMQNKHHDQIQYIAFLLYGIICGLSDGNKLIDHPRPMWLYFWLPVLMVGAQQLNSKQLQLNIKNRDS